jgi:TBC1 domain family protein 5
MFLYVSDNEEGKKTGYRQGMHELAACLYWVIDFDAVSSSSECTKEEELCSKEHVASDTLTLLTAILAAPSFSISRWYEHSPPSPTTEAPFKPPIARASEELLYRLRRIDPLLAGKLDRESIEGGIFGM